jgi:hypothetical protein
MVALLCAPLAMACASPGEGATDAAAGAGAVGAGAAAGAGTAAGAGAAANEGRSDGGSDSAPTCLPDPEPAGDGVYEGDVTLTTPSDVAAIVDFEEIRGSLRVPSTYSGVLELPNLRRLSGDLHIEGSPGPKPELDQVTSLRLANLQHLGGELWIYLAWSLSEVDLRSLESVTGQIFIMRNLSMRVARFDALQEVGGGVTFAAQTSLPQCVTALNPILGSAASANGSADTTCHCESPCGYVQAQCDW